MKEKNIENSSLIPKPSSSVASKYAKCYQKKLLWNLCGIFSDIPDPPTLSHLVGEKKHRGIKLSAFSRNGKIQECVCGGEREYILLLSCFETRSRLQKIISRGRARKNEAGSRPEFPASRILTDLCY